MADRRGRHKAPSRPPRCRPSRRGGRRSLMPFSSSPGEWHDFEPQQIAVRLQPRGAPAALEKTDLGAMQVAQIGERLLREASAIAVVAQVDGELGAHCVHNPTLAESRRKFHRRTSSRAVLSRGRREARGAAAFARLRMDRAPHAHPENSPVTTCTIAGAPGPAQSLTDRGSQGAAPRDLRRLRGLDVHKLLGDAVEDRRGRREANSSRPAAPGDPEDHVAGCVGALPVTFAVDARRWRAALVGLPVQRSCGGCTCRTGHHNRERDCQGAMRSVCHRPSEHSFAFATTITEGANRQGVQTGSQHVSLQWPRARDGDPSLASCQGGRGCGRKIRCSVRLSAFTKVFPTTIRRSSFAGIAGVWPARRDSGLVARVKTRDLDGYVVKAKLRSIVHRFLYVGLIAGVVLIEASRSGSPAVDPVGDGSVAGWSHDQQHDAHIQRQQRRSHRSGHG